MKSFTFYKLFFIALPFLLMGCNSQPKEKVQHTLHIEPQTMQTPLYFSGTIKPIETINIISSIDATVDHEYFAYGETVKSGQKLLTLVSDKLQQDFAEAISGYLKADADYKNKTKKFEASKELWRLQFISRDSYDADITAKKDAYIAFLQAEYKIIKIAKQLNVYNDLLKIKVVTPEIIKQLLLRSKNYIDITSPKDGVALFPEGGDSGNDNKPVMVGSQVKTGQVILSIGNLKGYKVSVLVDEVNINQIKVGQTAYVTGPAFNDFKLKGHVTRIDAQAKNQNNDLPQFPITVEIPSPTPEAQRIIHVGMSAKVAIEIPHPNVILVPIDAVFSKDGQTFVTIKTSFGTKKDIPVITGDTWMSSVEIKNGLKKGDLLVYPH